MLYSSYYSSYLGRIMLASDGNNLIGLWLEGQKYFADTVLEEIIEKPDLPVFIITKKWLDKYFNGYSPEISDLPLAPKGGEFRQTVWNILRDIPYGNTITYGEIAKILAHRMDKVKISSQAVGGAVGHNPISIIIPCHRVVGAKGNLTGYAGGIDKKINLLKHEGVDVSKLFIPTKGTAL